MPASAVQKNQNMFSWAASRVASSRSGPRLVRLGALAALVLLLSTSVITYRNMSRFEESAALVAHTHEVMHALEDVVSLLIESDASVRSFQLTGRDDMLAVFNRSQHSLSRQVADLRNLVRDNASQLERLGRLEIAARQTLQQLEPLSEIRWTRNDADAATLNDQLLASGARLSVARRVAGSMAAEESRLLNERSELNRDNADLIKFWLLAGEGAALLMLIVAYLILQREISQRIAAEQSRARAASEIEDLYNRAPCGYHSVDTSGLIIRINDTQLNWLGYRREEVVGKMSHADLMTPESAALFHREMFPLFRQRGWLKDVEFDYRRKDGSVMPGLLNATSVYDADGRYLWSRTTLYDITERRQTERKMRKLHEDLERHAHELQAANKELESYGYSISHDLRAPLRAVDGFARMFEEDYGAQVDDEGRRRLRVIRDNSRRMGQLIDDLLAFSHIGRRQKMPTPTDMRMLAQEVWEELIAEQTPPAFELGELPVAVVDRALFKQVWINLLGNAIKYSSKNTEPRVRVSAVEHGNEIEYRIEDNGAGFDMKYYDKLFGVFQRLHAHSEFPGSGVGLAIVQRVVTRHGGRVWAQAVPGQGATFFFTVPKGD